MSHCRPYGEDMFWPYWEDIFSDGGVAGGLGLAYSANITHPSRNCKRQIEKSFPKKVRKKQRKKKKELQHQLRENQP